MSARTSLPDRRPGYTTKVAWSPTRGGPDHNLIVTFGFDADWCVREAFCASFRAEGGFVALANDACVVLSRLLQHGEDIQDISASMSENRQEGAAGGPPASILGAICRAGVRMQDAMRSLNRPRLVTPAGAGGPTPAGPPTGPRRDDMGNNPNQPGQQKPGQQQPQQPKPGQSDQK
jgi:hypothetical protein